MCWGWGLADVARHVTGCYSTQEPRIQHALDDVASNICQALTRGGRGADWRVGAHGERVDQRDVRRQLGAAGPDGGAGVPAGGARLGKGGVVRTSNRPMLNRRTAPARLYEHSP